MGERVGCANGGDVIPKEEKDDVAGGGRVEVGWGGGALKREVIAGVETLVVVVAEAVVVLGPLALWKSSKSSSPAVDDTTAFPVEGAEIVGADGTSSSKLNKSTSFFLGGGAVVSFFGVDLRGMELRWTVARAPPSSNSS